MEKKLKNDMKKRNPIDHDFVGQWVSCDELGSTVKHQVSVVKGEYKIACVDTYDGELAEVYDVKWDGEKLLYCLHWASTGRFSKNSMSQQAKDQIELTYTHTDTELLRRIPKAEDEKNRKKIKKNSRPRGKKIE